MAKKFTKKPINEERLKRAEKVTEELHQEKEPALPKVEKKDTKRRAGSFSWCKKNLLFS